MSYNHIILQQINIINEELYKLQELPVSENKGFSIDTMSWDNYLKINFRRDNCINFDLIFSPLGIQINIDRAIELLEFNIADLENFKKNVKEFMFLLFMYTIIVEYCGINYTKLFFIDKTGKCIKTFKYVRGFYLRLGCVKKEYLPIYQKNII